jgi:3D (Asp-Asp-Asp) domain-containing protein
MAEGLACGSELRIDGLEGSWKVVDRTAARHTKHIDIYMGKDVKAARAWGVKDVEIIWQE